MMDQDQEEKRRKRILRWGKKQGIVSVTIKGYKQTVTYKDGRAKTTDISDLLKEGLIDKKGTLTEAGELRLHQLNLIKWIITHPRKKKGAK